MGFAERHRNFIFLNIISFLLVCVFAVIRSLPISPWDEQVLRSVMGLQGSAWFPFMTALSTVLNPVVLVSFSLVLVGILLYRRQVTWALFFLLSMLCASASALFLKDFFEVLRPVQSVIPEIGWSFPSIHATVAATFFLSLCYAVEETAHDVAIITLLFLISIGLVFGVGVSRTYLGVHWVSDVLAGFSLGAFWVTLGILCLKRVSESYIGGVKDN